jgi:hypothetical protein
MWFALLSVSWVLVHYLIARHETSYGGYIDKNAAAFFISMAIMAAPSALFFDSVQSDLIGVYQLLSEFLFPLLAALLGRFLGVHLPDFSQKLTDAIKAWFRRIFLRHKKRVGERAKSRAAKKQAILERKAASPKEIRKRCAQGVASIHLISRRNPEFWEPMVAYVRVLGTRGTKGVKSELERLLARRIALEQDIARLQQHESKDSHSDGFVSNRATSITSLEKRLGNVNRLAALLVHQLNDLDDDMADIEADIPTSLTFAQERRDALAKELNTILDAIELEIGVSARRSQEEAIARADAEIDKLTSGELRAVQANTEIDELMQRLGMRPLEAGSPMSFRPKERPDVASLEAQRASRARPRQGA